MYQLKRFELVNFETAENDEDGQPYYKDTVIVCSDDINPYSKFR